MAQNVITFNGSNDKLFSRVDVGELQPKTSLIVPETHSAIVVKDGEMLQTLSKGKYLFDDMIEIKKDEAYSLEVLFISKTAKLKLLWGTPNKIAIADPILNQSYRVGMSGDFEVQVSDPRKCFLYLVGAEQGLTADTLQERLQSMVVSVVEEVLTAVIDEQKIGYANIFHCKKEISQVVTPRLSSSFSSAYGIMVSAFNITNIIFDENDLKALNLNSKERQQDAGVSVAETSQDGEGALKNGGKIYCSQCGNELPSGAKFCSQCGAKVEARNVCTKCGNELPANAKFCSECGERV